MAPYFNDSSVIATKSTVPAGTSREIKRRLHELRPDRDLVVCSNPEFLREGSAIRDFMHPDRVLIGCSDSHARDVMLQLYNPWRVATRQSRLSARVGRTCQIRS
jgi:UDPglucose 6-dehydrogenase